MKLNVILMNLVEDTKGLKPNYIIITGDGRFELKIMRGLTYKYNGYELVLFFPFSPLSKKKGLNALDAVEIYSGRFKIYSMIYIVDGDAFKGKPADIEIKNYLLSIGIRVKRITSIEDALLINCKYGSKNIILYCIISGPEIFIEQEVAKLFKNTFGSEFNLLKKKESNWKQQFKKSVHQFMKKKKIKIDDFIKKTEIKKLEIAFPNYCAVLKKIEENSHK